MNSISTSSTLADQMDDSPAPLYVRIKRVIVQQIENGTWVPHQRLPSENELVQSLGFSRMTVHRALRELTTEGRLVRMQGVGTFVAAPKVQSALFEVLNIADETAGHGSVYSNDVLVLRACAAEHETSSVMDVPAGHPLFHSLTIHLENNVPLQIEQRYVDAVLTPQYAVQDFTKITPSAYLSAIAPITEGEHIVEAVLATEDECQLLHIEVTEPCVLIRRRTWSDGRLITAARLINPGSRHRLESRFERR